MESIESDMDNLSTEPDELNHSPNQWYRYIGLSHLKPTPLCGKNWNSNKNQYSRSFLIQTMFKDPCFRSMFQSTRNGVEETFGWIFS